MIFEMVAILEWKIFQRQDFVKFVGICFFGSVARKNGPLINRLILIPLQLFLAF